MKKKTAFCGIDVSSRKLDVCVEVDGSKRTAVFDNTGEGHRKVISYLTRKGSSAMVVVEATGIYSFELSMALHLARRIQVMVVNPRSASDFARAMTQRSKTDKADAQSLLEYAKRMPFVEWQPPSTQALSLQRIMRSVSSQTSTRIRENNRLHAARQLAGTESIQAEIKRHIQFLDESSERLREEALEIVSSDPELNKTFRLLTSVKGIAIVSGLALLAELATLPDDMSARQWVAHTGLDPRHVESGTSLQRKPRISKRGNVHLRAALYMPALVAIQHEPSVRAFYDKLVGRGKAKMVALVAVMRKLLHAIHGMIRTNTDFDGVRFHACAP